MPETQTGLYVHVPFCARTCDYCAFYQATPDAKGVQKYLDDVRREAALIRWPERIDTVFWGGGTPGLLSAKDLGKLGSVVREACGGRLPAEWSVEMTPVAATQARLESLREAGVTRISLGVQSFRDDLLKALGRDHTTEQAIRAVERVRSAGFKDLNIDLMFALPGQRDEDWLEDLARATDLGPDHLSTYCLTFEEDTKLWVKLSKGGLKRDIEAEARLYATTWERLALAGYAQYEISNFARPGHECIHNLNTWRMHEWIGLGPSAASQHQGCRGTNVADLAEWSARLDKGIRADEDHVDLTPALLAEDAIIFGLRMNQGVDLAQWKQRAPLARWEAAEQTLESLREEGLLEREGEAVKLSARGRMLADSVGEQFVGLLST